MDNSTVEMMVELTEYSMGWTMAAGKVAAMVARSVSVMAERTVREMGVQMVA